MPFSPGKHSGMQIGRLQRWHRRRGEPAVAAYDASDTETTAWATPEELRDLSARVLQAVQDWQRSIDADDGQERTPVFFFAHAFPTEP